jgi:hypothetical protein
MFFIVDNQTIVYEDPVVVMTVAVLGEERLQATQPTLASVCFFYYESIFAAASCSWWQLCNSNNRVDVRTSIPFWGRRTETRRQTKI